MTTEPKTQDSDDLTIAYMAGLQRGKDHAAQALASKEAELVRLREALSLLTVALEDPISVQMTRAQLAFRGRAALTRPQDFDTWQANPYTKVLQKSIDEDYVPKFDRPQEVEAPVENAPSYGDLVTALAECRDAFPVPGPGQPLEHEWAEAIGYPMSVPAYVKLAASRVPVALPAAEWEKLRDPAILHANLLRGLPSQLTKAHLLHLLGSDAPPKQGDAKDAELCPPTAKEISTAERNYLERGSMLSGTKSCIVEHAASPAPTKQQPALGRGEVGGVPLSDEQISQLWDGHTVPVFGKTGINPIVFARAIEAAHGIGKAPTGQINPDSAGQGMEGVI